MLVVVVGLPSQQQNNWMLQVSEDIGNAKTVVHYHFSVIKNLTRKLHGHG